MPNGKPGDHPLTDILIHDKEYYSEETRAFIREIYEINGRRLNTFQHIDWSNEDDLKKQLIELKRKLESDEW